jgi:hypothetical protein
VTQWNLSNSRAQRSPSTQTSPHSQAASAAADGVHLLQIRGSCELTDTTLCACMTALSLISCF